MTPLEEARKTINEVDAQMAELFLRRMEAVDHVATYKMENGMPVTDPAREAEVLAQNTARIADPVLQPYYADFLRETMKVSRDYQNRILTETAGGLYVRTAEGGYEVRVKRGCLDHAGELLRLDRKVLVVTDDGVPAEYAEKVASFCEKAFVETIPHGEESKSLAMLERLCRRLTDEKFTRTDCVVAVGGGVVGDLSGLTAAVYMRGIDFYNIPTTLLSQVDSSIGGKTAIDFCGAKNLFGAFYQPKAVLIDPDVLATLPERQLKNGMAEAIKVGLTSDPDLFAIFEKGEEREKIDEVILRALHVKQWVVERDEKESGPRMLLNFGHTVGHAVESAQELHGLLHGESVALGMIPMCAPEVRERLVPVLERLGLPTVLPVPPEEVLARLSADKKRAGGRISAVLVPHVGNGVFCTMPMEEYQAKILPSLKKMIRSGN